MQDDGLAYVQEDGIVFNNPGGRDQKAQVPDGQEQIVKEAAEECPGCCIFVEE